MVLRRIRIEMLYTKATNYLKNSFSEVKKGRIYPTTVLNNIRSKIKHTKQK